MNLSNPILICDGNEEYRILLREMLTKNGFFHVLETSSPTETLKILQTDKKKYFVLVEARVLNDELIRQLQLTSNFVVLTESDEEHTYQLASRLGVRHLMSFPFHSEKLVQKINSFI